MEIKSPNPFETRKSLENPHIIGKLSLMRHGDTLYTNQPPDLTPEGIERVRKTARYLKERIKREKEEVLYIASPSIRAKGTLSVVLEELGEADAEMRIVKAMRSAEKRNPEKANPMIEEVDWRTDINNWDKLYAIDERFEKLPDVWQPRSEIEQRFYRGLNLTISFFIKNRIEKKTAKIPHLIAVSHFEFIYPFVMRVFSLDPEKDRIFGFAEIVEMEIGEPVPQNTNQVPIGVFFRGQARNIIFDRRDYSIKIIEE